MAWQKGSSGNPAGRPPKMFDGREKLRGIFERKAPELIAKAIELALTGDTQALKMCLDRLVPVIKALELTVVSGDQKKVDALRDLAERMKV